MSHSLILLRSRVSKIDSDALRRTSQIKKCHWFSLLSTAISYLSSMPELATLLMTYIYIYLPIPVYVPSPSYLQNVQPSCFFFSSSSLLSTRATRQCAYASSGCDQKKITLYRNFFRNLNFKNIVNFLKRTCISYSFLRYHHDHTLSTHKRTYLPKDLGVAKATWKFEVNIKSHFKLYRRN